MGLIKDGERHLCLTREFYFLYELQGLYMFINFSSLYHAISLSILMKRIMETMFPYYPSNSKIRFEIMVVLEREATNKSIIFLFLKCLQSYQQNQTKYNPKMPKRQLWMWSGVFSLKIFSNYCKEKEYCHVAEETLGTEHCELEETLT